MESKNLINHFAAIRTGYNWRDGDEVQECKIVGRIGTKYNVVSKSGTNYTVEISDIRRLIDVTERPMYKVGDRVLAVVEYHWKDGEYYDVCDILQCTQFCNSIEYIANVQKTGKRIILTQSAIKRIVTLQTPKYTVGQYVGVKHCDGHPYYYDEYIKNGTIVSVDAKYDRCTYNIKYDDGKVDSRDETSLTQPHREKTQSQKDADYASYLVSEEQRLLQQLKNVQAQMRR